MQDAWIDELVGRSEELRGRAGAGDFKGDMAMGRRWGSRKRRQSREAWRENWRGMLYKSQEQDGKIGGNAISYGRTTSGQWEQ